MVVIFSFVFVHYQLGTINSPVFLDPTMVDNGVRVSWIPSNTSDIDRYILTCDPSCGTAILDPSQISTVLTNLAPGSYIIMIHAVDVCELESDVDRVTADVLGKSIIGKQRATHMVYNQNLRYIMSCTS